MVPVERLRPGMRVKIVDQWNSMCDQNREGLMDKYLGKIVTIRSTYNNDVFIEEDSEDINATMVGGHWFWNSYCFDYIVEDGINNPDDFEVSSIDEVLSLICGR